MSGWGRKVEARWPSGLRRASLALLATGLVAVTYTASLANGVNQREIQGRVASVDAAAGTLVVTSEFRGRTTRVTLRAAPGIRIYDCASEHASLERVRKGMSVSAFYEVVGSDGVVNLIVVEPSR